MTKGRNLLPVIKNNNVKIKYNKEIKRIVAPSIFIKKTKKTKKTDSNQEYMDKMSKLHANEIFRG
jgi:hypothetical protein